VDASRIERVSDKGNGELIVHALSPTGQIEIMVGKGSEQLGQ
jgi:hypothetical protein